MAVQPDGRWVAEHLARWRDAGEPEALGELLKWQRDRAFAVARRILGNDAEAEDAVQQAFLKLFRSGATFPAANAFQAAVYRSVTHSAIDFARNRQARRLVEHAMARHDRPLPPSPGQAMENREAVRILQQEMEALAPEDRALLALCCQEGLSLVAAAESLDLPRETARDRLARSLTELRNRLARRGVALSLLLLLGLFQQGRSAQAGEALCATLDAALPGAACTGIVPASAAGVSTATLLAQAGLSAGVWSAKVYAGIAAVVVLSASAATWSLLGGASGEARDAGLTVRTPEPANASSVDVKAVVPDPAPVQVPQVEDAVPPPPPPPPVVNDKRDDDDDEEIPLADVPAAIREAVLTAAPDIEITSVEREKKDGRVIYDVKGRAGGQFIEIELSEDGQVLKVERKDKDEQGKDEHKRKEKGMPPPVEPKAGDASEF